VRSAGRDGRGNLTSCHLVLRAMHGEADGPGGAPHFVVELCVPDDSRSGGSIGMSAGRGAPFRKLRGCNTFRAQLEASW